MKGSILIVEDEKIVAQDIKNKVKDLGYSVVDIVDTGEEAVAVAEEKKPEVVLMDIKLKGEMDGVEAAEKIDVPVVYLTAYADEDLLERAKITTPLGYIVKPFEKQDLKIALKMGLYKHEMEKKLERSREKYRMLFNNAGIPMILIDGEKKILLINEEFDRAFNDGTDRVEVGMEFTDIIDDGCQKMLDQHLYLQDIEKRDIPVHLELELSFGDEKRSVFSTCRSITDTDEKVISLLEVSSYDDMIGELKKVEELLKMGFEGEYDLQIPTGLSNFFGRDYFDHVKSSSLDELFLLLIMLRGRASGVQLLADINTLFGTSLNPSMMYPRLRNMNESGLLEKIEKPKKKEYHIKDEDECLRMIRDKIENLFKVNIVLKFFLDRVKKRDNFTKT